MSLFQKRNDFLQLLLDTSKELSASGELDINEKDDIVENYGKEDTEMFKQTIYSKKSKYQIIFIRFCFFFLIEFSDIHITF